MPLFVDDVEIDDVVVDAVPIDEVYANSVLVWERFKLKNINVETKDISSLFLDPGIVDGFGLAGSDLTNLIPLVYIGAATQRGEPPCILNTNESFGSGTSEAWREVITIFWGMRLILTATGLSFSIMDNTGAWFPVSSVLVYDERTGFPNTIISSGDIGGDGRIVEIEGNGRQLRIRYTLVQEEFPWSEWLTFTEVDI